MPPVSYRIVNRRWETGEHYRMLDKVDDDGIGMPCYWPTLYVSTQLRNTGRAVATMEAALGAIRILLEFLDEREIDIEKRVLDQEYLRHSRTRWPADRHRRREDHEFALTAPRAPAPLSPRRPTSNRPPGDEDGALPTPQPTGAAPHTDGEAQSREPRSRPTDPNRRKLARSTRHAPGERQTRGRTYPPGLPTRKRSPTMGRAGGASAHSRPTIEPPAT